MTEHTRNQIFFERYPKNFFFKIFTLVLLDRFLDGFSKFGFFIGELHILIRDFWVIFENYSMPEHTRNRFHGMLSIRGTNFRTCSVSGKMWTFLHVQSMLSIRDTRNEFYRTLSILGTNFIACWAYWEPISSHAEHARKCFKVEYLGWIKYDFQKSRDTDPWDHKDSVSAKKVRKKISCFYTFKGYNTRKPSASNTQEDILWISNKLYKITVG